MSYIRGVIFYSFLLSLFSCNTPAVSSKKPKRIVVASDFLQAEDSIFFEGFNRKEEIKIVILPMETDSIIAHYNEHRYNSKFDIVLMGSTYALNELSNNNMLHPISEEHLLKNRKFVSRNNDWMILGVDPYIVAGDSLEKDLQYNELTYGKKWRKKLTDEEMTAFQASVLFQFGRKNMNKSLAWLTKIESQAIQDSDSIQQIAPYSLTRLSLARTDNQPFVYPSQSSRFGAFYDGIGMGIVRHSSKYTAALAFIDHYSNIVYNQRLCNKLDILPINNPNGLSAFEYQNDYPVLFRCEPKEAASLFRDLKRIRKRI